ncbi:MAG: hypothetical protein NTX36_02520 [Proteobacteria bacterium]|nr:hypothetical protein [Pseudomonadota bacterium]
MRWTEDRRQKTEDRRQRTEDRRQISEDRFKSVFCQPEGRSDF